MSHSLNWTSLGHYSIYGDGSYSHRSRIGVSCSLLYFDNKLFGKEMIRSHFEDSLEVEIVSSFWMLKYLPPSSTVHVYNDCEGVQFFYKQLNKSEDKVNSWISNRKSLRHTNFNFYHQLLDVLMIMKSLNLTFILSNEDRSDNIRFCDRASRQFLQTRKKSIYDQLVIEDSI